MDNKKEKLEVLERELAKLAKKGAKPSDDSKMPKNVEQCKAMIEKAREALLKEEQKVQNKEDNKNLALGTSKINYMDPRITISWCKHKEVPIEKIFTSNLRQKFAWAMANEINWRF